MVPIPQRRPSAEGFLQLLPDDTRRSVKFHLDKIDRLAREALTSNEQSRKLALDAIWEEEQGFPDRARKHRNEAQLDHQRGCDHLYRAAMACRALLRACALDWRPTLDVAASGLTEAELASLCAVFGPQSGEEVQGA